MSATYSDCRQHGSYNSDAFDECPRCFNARRDMFAAHAMQWYDLTRMSKNLGAMPDRQVVRELLTEQAYLMADEMMKERDETNRNAMTENDSRGG